MLRIPSILRHPTTIVVLGAILTLDACAVSPLRDRRSYHPPRIHFVRSEAGLAVATDESDLSQIVGSVLAFNLRKRVSGFWAPTSRVLDPQVLYVTHDGSLPSLADYAQVRAGYADEIAGRFRDPQLAAVIRAGGPPVFIPIVSGYIHNSVALLVASALVLSIILVFMDKNRAALAMSRVQRGECPSCGYNRSGLSSDSPCPECGATLYASPCAASSSTP